MLKRAWTFLIFLSLSGAILGQSTASSTISATIVKMVGIEENSTGENVQFVSRSATTLAADPVMRKTISGYKNTSVTNVMEIASVKLWNDDYSFGVTQIADISMQNAAGEMIVVEDIAVNITRSPGFVGGSSSIKVLGTFKISTQNAGHYRNAQSMDVIITFE